MFLRISATCFGHLKLAVFWLHRIIQICAAGCLNRVSRNMWLRYANICRVFGWLYSFLYYKCFCPFWAATLQSTGGFELLYFVVETPQFITACRHYQIPALVPVATYAPLRYLGKESLAFTVRMSTRSPVLSPQRITCHRSFLNRL
jgi:hypothetical protein